MASMSCFQLSSFSAFSSSASQSRRGLTRCFFVAGLVLFGYSLPIHAEKTSPAKTETVLLVTALGQPATSVAQGSAVTLTATVSSHGIPVTAGQVNFCQAKATYCDAIHMYGSAQITKAGSATIRFMPGMGAQHIRAIFAGTNTEASSQSQAATLDVSASQPTTTTITQNGTSGDFALTATVTGSGPLAPTGKVSFFNTSQDNKNLGKADLGESVIQQSYIATSNSLGASFSENLATADFNGDGIPDLAVVVQNYAFNIGAVGDTEIFLGKGDGTFAQSNQVIIYSGATPSAALAAAVGDFNHDGNIDLAITSEGSIPLSICLGDGTGNFTCTAGPSVATNTPLLVGDFNNDGLQDILAGNNVLLGNGDGTFKSAASGALATFSNPGSIAEGDFNGDGITDLAFTGGSATSITILAGNGDGTFATYATIPAVSNPGAVAVGDFNQDGRSDLVVESISGQVATLLNQGEGKFSTIANQPFSSPYNPGNIVVADFNGDGLPDVASWEGLAGSSNLISTRLGNGDGTFTTGASVTSPYQGRLVIAGDWNGDGLTDLFGTAAGIGLNAEYSVGLSQRMQTVSASITNIAPHAGQNLVDAVYKGDSDYATSTSTTTTLTENKK